MRHYALSVNCMDVLREDWQAAAAESRIRNIELSRSSVFPTADDSAKQVKILQQLRDRNDLKVSSLHLPFYPFEQWGFASPDEALRRQTVESTIEFIHRYTSLGFQNITIHSGGEPNLPEERKLKMKQMRRTVEELLPFIKEIGASLNLELLPRTCLGNCEEELLFMLDGFPAEHVNICLDINHLMGRFREIPDIISRLGSRIRSFHLSDYDGIDETHWQVGLGIIDWCAVLNAMNTLSQDVLLILEISHVTAPRRDIDPKIWFRNAVHAFRELEFAPELRKLEESMIF